MKKLIGAREIQERFGRQVRALRGAQLLTAEEMAEAVATESNFPYKRYLAIDAADESVRPYEIQELAGLLGLDVTWMYRDEPEDKWTIRAKKRSK